MSDDLKIKLEALLFASARALTIEELSKLLRERDPNKIKLALADLAESLSKKGSSLMLVEENDTYRFTVREKYLRFVRKVVTKTELSKSILETLAVIAYKAPLLQSKLIKIRTNKAYDHLRHLEKTGYITREKHGRTKMIKLTQKFYNYFDIAAERLKQRFGNADEIENAIEKKEIEMAALHPELAQKAERQASAGGHAPHLEVVVAPPIVDTPKISAPLIEAKEQLGDLDVYQTKRAVSAENIKTAGELGEMQVYDIDLTHPHEHRKRLHKREKVKAPEPKSPPAPETSAAHPQKSPKNKGMFPRGVPPEVQKKVDERVQELVSPSPDEESPPEEKP